MKYSLPMRLFTRLFNKNSLKAVKAAQEPRKLPNQKEFEGLPKNPYKLVGVFWAIGIPTTLILFYFETLLVDAEKKFYYKQIRDELREEQAQLKAEQQ